MLKSTIQKGNDNTVKKNPQEFQWWRWSHRQKQQCWWQMFGQQRQGALDDCISKCWWPLNWKWLHKYVYAGNQTQENTNGGNFICAAEANDNYNKSHVNKFLGDNGKVHLLNVFLNTDKNPFEYIFKRDTTGRVICVDFCLKDPWNENSSYTSLLIVFSILQLHRRLGLMFCTTMSH